MGVEIESALKDDLIDLYDESKNPFQNSSFFVTQNELEIYIVDRLDTKRHNIRDMKYLSRFTIHDFRPNIVNDSIRTAYLLPKRVRHINNFLLGTPDQFENSEIKNEWIEEKKRRKKRT